MPSVQPRRAFLLLSCAYLAAGHVASADNGAIAYARHTEPIAVDGDLNDWDPTLPVYSVSEVLAGEMAASFRVAYNSEQQALYVAMEIEDNVHIAPEDSLDTWYLRDSHILYVDPEHSPSGSAPFVFSAAGNAYSIVPEEKSWSAVHRIDNSSSASHAFKRTNGVSTYEWRVHLGERVKPGATIGLDHIVIDIDSVRSSSFSAVALWGKFQAKANRSGRLGDVLLMPEEVQMGNATGSIAWAEGTSGPDLSGWRVRIQSKDSAERWFQISTSEEGVFDLWLPAGEYTIASPFLLYDTPSDPIYDLRLEDRAESHFTIHAGESIDLGVIEWAASDPLTIPSEPGFLFTYDDSREAELTTFIKRAMEHYQIAGASIALIVGGKLAYSRDFGMRNGYSNDPVDRTTLFEAGSITKALFALCVMRLAERGVIDLDAPLFSYLPFEEIADDPRSRLITARHVLSHQTGLPNWRSGSGDDDMAIGFVPGTSYSYSGEAFEYLGRVVTKVTGKTLEQVFQEEVIVPFEGDPANLVFADDGSLIERVAFGHDLDRPNTPQLPKKAAPAYSLQTNARGLAPLMESMLARRALSESSYDAMLVERTLKPESASSKEWQTYFGLGVQILDTEFGKAFGHTGLNGANNAIFEAYDEQGAGFIVLTNSDVGRQFYLDLREFLVVGGE